MTVQAATLPPAPTAIERVGRLATVGIGISIPISVAADNALLAFIAICFLAGGRYRAWLTALRANPVWIAALVLFGAFVAGAFHTLAPSAEAGRNLLKYGDLLFIPIIGAYFHDPATRRLGLQAFAAAIAGILLLSSALYTGVIPRSELFVDNAPYALVFKDSLTHAILMAFGAFLFAQLGWATQSKPHRWLWYVLAAAAVLNMILLVSGRTGYVVLGALLLYTGYGWRRWTGMAVMVAVSALVFAGAYHGSYLFQQRVDRAWEEYSSWQPDTATSPTSSVGLRMEFYRHSLAIVLEHPVAGVGTGGFPQAYAEQARKTGRVLARNPHNEYLLVTVQLGLIGLLLLLHLFWQQWRLAPRLPSALETHVARGLVLTMAAGCLFNSLLLDHTEGLFFAWLTGLLFAGLRSAGDQEGRNSGDRSAVPT